MISFQTKRPREENVFEQTRTKAWDPWFDEQYGKLDVAKFTDSYSFIKDLQK